MRRVLGILCVSALAWISAGVSMADDYVEDVYFWQDTRAMESNGTIVPSYNKRAKEIVFIEDTTGVQHPDTVRAVIRDVRN